MLFRLFALSVILCGQVHAQSLVPSNRGPALASAPIEPLAITTATLSNGQGGSVYSQTLAATGGVAPYSWSLASGELPSGITLASDGTISGTPTVFGAFNFTAQVTDNTSASETKAFAITIVPAQPAVALVGSTLTVTFGSSDDIVSFNFSLEAPTLMIKYQVAGDWSPLSPLLLAGNPINMSAIAKWVIQFGDGNDRLDEPSGRVPDLWIYGGAGNDVIKAPPGDGSTRIYGGTGNDQLNAEHAQDNWLYGEDGNDSLWGSSDGLNYLDGGAGDNSLYSSPNTARPPYDAITTLVYHQGGTGFWSDLGANSGYQFISDGSSASGSLYIYDSNGNGPTTDVLDFSRWSYAVSVNPVLTTPQIISVNNLSQPILTLSLLGGSFEQVIQPLAITTATLPNGQGGSVYSQTLAATGGTVPYTWSLASGALPAALTLASNGVISGALPSAYGFGTFSFTARVTDSASVTTTKAFTLTVAPVPPVVTLVSGVLTVTFGDADDLMEFTFLTGATLTITYMGEEDWNAPQPLLFQGNPILMNTVTKWVIDLGGGDDNLANPIGRVPDLWIYGGSGNDTIHTPAGPGLTHVYGGPGDDQVNAEHSQDNWVYGEEGNDFLSGSNDGFNLLDGGPGSNLLTSNKHILQPPLGKKTTLVYHQGATDIWTDNSADNIFQFISDGSITAGTLTIFGAIGTDVLDFSQWSHPVSVNTALTTPQVISVGNTAQPLLTLTLASGGIEQVIQPLDSNANSIPDTWEIQYFGSTSSPNGAANFDTDGDGMTNLEEYLAGTSPVDSTSKLRLLIGSVGPSGAVLQFPTVTGRLYTVEYSDTLAFGSWNILAPANRPGTGEALEVSDPDMPARRFYRLSVSLP